jgi:hypothetical protein
MDLSKMVVQPIAIKSLSHEQRLLFHEVLAHNLAVCIRAIAFSSLDSEACEKLEEIKWINEILHRVTAKIRALWLQTHNWNEGDFFNMIDEYVRKYPVIEKHIEWALGCSFQSTK